MSRPWSGLARTIESNRLVAMYCPKAYRLDNNFQQSEKELNSRRFLITPLQFGQERWPVLLGARLPHDRASVPRLGLARRFSGGPIGQQVVHGERARMGGVGVQGMHQRRS